MLLRKENVFIDLEVADTDELFETVGRHMIDGGFAKDSFIQALKDREKVFPTGLPSGRESHGSVGVGLPHSDACHVLIPATAVIRLKKPIRFIMMGSNDVVIDARVVFMLLLEEGESQLTMLQKLMDIIQDDDFMKKIMDCASPDELFELLKDLI